jgi:type IV pilus assembly protein PilX
MLRHTFRPTRSTQKGATLVVALLVLVLVMMIGIAAINTSQTQYTLAGNLQFEDGAMNNAETALVTAENWLVTGANCANGGFTTRVSGGLYPIPTSGTQPVDALALDWSSAATAVSVSSSQGYIVQQLSSNTSLIGANESLGGQGSATSPRVNTYLISARGTSARGSRKIVQSYFSVQTPCT